MNPEERYQAFTERYEYAKANPNTEFATKLKKAIVNGDFDNEMARREKEKVATPETTTKTFTPQFTQTPDPSTPAQPAAEETTQPNKAQLQIQPETNPANQPILQKQSEKGK